MMLCIMWIRLDALKGVVPLDDYVKLELNASEKGWNCSGCGLFTDCVGRPCFGDEAWMVITNSKTWLENKPKYKFCPGCGKPIKGDNHA